MLLAIRTYNIHFYGIKSFYDHFCPGQNMTGDFKRMKEPHHLPVVLSKQEAFAMIDAAPNLKIKTVVAVFYSSGQRLEEYTSLKLTDIDRSRKEAAFTVQFDNRDLILRCCGIVIKSYFIREKEVLVS
jgi:site-specific recombinase XerD